MRYELVDEFGSGIAKHSERLIISRPIPNGNGGKPEKRQVPVLLLDHLLIGSRGVSLSADALALCCERGIPITLIGFAGRPIASFTSPALHGTCRTRRAQIASYDTRLGAHFAKSIVSGKIQNEAANLKYFCKNRKEQQPEVCEQVLALAAHLDSLADRAADVQADSADSARQALLQIEAEAAKLYWRSIALIYAEKAGFAGREHRGTKNPANAALNYAYGILSCETWTAVLVAGLEPYAGILHADRPGRLSFVLDLMEEFRPVVADRTVFGLAAKGWKPDLQENGWLTYPSKRRLLDALQERWDTPLPYNGRRVKLRNILQFQAREAAQHFLAKAQYRAFRVRW
jgi:CRISPR-associated protein Cas1